MAGRLVGLTGKARSGKDSLAAELLALGGWQRVAFADLLRAKLLQLDPEVRFPMVRGWTYTSLSSALRQAGGWEALKDIPGLGGEVRGMLQRLGSGMREVDPAVWLRPALAEAAALRSEGVDVVITDVRFRNEAAAIREFGGVVVRVYRPCVDGAGSHVSETELESIVPDFAVHNMYDVEHLRREARALSDIV